MVLWQIWLIVAVILFIAEVVTPGFVVACFGIGCLGAALMDAIGLGIAVQIVVFCVVSLASFFSVRPLFLKYVLKGDEKRTDTNVDALAGKLGLVSETIDPETNRGRVALGGDDWKAVSVADTVIEKGQKVEVVSVEGTKLFVKAVSKKGEQQS